MGRVVREMDATGWGLFSAMAADISSAIDGCNGALGVLRGEWERLDVVLMIFARQLGMPNFDVAGPWQERQGYVWSVPNFFRPYYRCFARPLYFL